MINKTLFQCGKWEYEYIPKYVAEYMETWRLNNLDFDFVYMSDEQCGKFIAAEYGIEMFKLYDLIPRGDNRADFWRYLVVNKYGGFYADLDTICYGKIDKLYKHSNNFVVTKNTYMDIGTIWENWFFGSSADNIILQKLIFSVVDNISKETCSINAHHTFFPFNKVVSQHLDEPWVGIIGEEIKNIVGHIAAHDEWDNPEYFKNGGPS